MSRGMGKLQRAVRDLVADRGRSPIGTIAWQVALNEGAVTPNDDIDGEVYNGILRAARSLVQGPHAELTTSEAVFKTLDEFIEMYPDRTKSGATRQLRQHLLPRVRDYLKQRPARSPIRTEDWVLGRSDSAHREAIARHADKLDRLLGGRRRARPTTQ